MTRSNAPAFTVGFASHGRRRSGTPHGGYQDRLRAIGIIALLVGSMLTTTTNATSSQTLNEIDALSNKLFELYNAGKYAEAIPLAEHIVAMLEKTFGRNHPMVANALSSLADLCREEQVGRDNDAELLYKRSLAIREKVLGLNHPHVRTALDKLAALYEKQGRQVEAQRLRQRFNFQ